MNISSPFTGRRGNGLTTSYENVGRKKSKYKTRDIENLSFGAVYTDPEEIELCLTCPYPKCKERCDRLREHRKAKKVRSENE